MCIRDSLTVDIRPYHQADADQDTGDDTCDEQIADRLTGRYTEHNKDQARRDNNAKASGNSYHRSGEVLIITQTNQQRNTHCANCSCRCRTRTGNRSVENTGNNYGAGKSGSSLSYNISEYIE